MALLGQQPWGTKAHCLWGVHQCGFVKALGSQEQGGGVPQRKPIAAMSDTKLGVQVKGEEARVEGTKPSCQVLGNLNPKAQCQGQATVPKITSQENLIILRSLAQYWLSGQCNYYWLSPYYMLAPWKVQRSGLPWRQGKPTRNNERALKQYTTQCQPAQDKPQGWLKFTERGDQGVLLDSWSTWTEERKTQ